MAEELDKPLAVDVDIDPDFEPQKRPRSCTWPLPRPESNSGKAEPSDVGIIPEEEVDENGTDDACASGDITGASKPASVTEGDQSSAAAVPAIETNASANDKDIYGSPVSSQHALAACNDSSINGLIPQQPRKSSARRNAWGNYSYADLITQAIESSPEKRLTLAQIYDWMVRNVPYFKDKGDSNSSAGWKVRQVKCFNLGFLLTLNQSNNNYFPMSYGPK